MSARRTSNVQQHHAGLSSSSCFPAIAWIQCSLDGCTFATRSCQSFSTQCRERHAELAFHALVAVYPEAREYNCGYFANNNVRGSCSPTPDIRPQCSSRTCYASVLVGFWSSLPRRACIVHLTVHWLQDTSNQVLCQRLGTDDHCQFDPKGCDLMFRTREAWLKHAQEVHAYEGTLKTCQLASAGEIPTFLEALQLKSQCPLVKVKSANSVLRYHCSSNGTPGPQAPSYSGVPLRKIGACYAFAHFRTLENGKIEVRCKSCVAC